MPVHNKQERLARYTTLYRAINMLDPMQSEIMVIPIDDLSIAELREFNVANKNQVAKGFKVNLPHDYYITGYISENPNYDNWIYMHNYKTPTTELIGSFDLPNAGENPQPLYDQIRKSIDLAHSVYPMLVSINKHKHHKQELQNQVDDETATIRLLQKQLDDYIENA